MTSSWRVILPRRFHAHFTQSRFRRFEYELLSTILFVGSSIKLVSPASPSPKLSKTVVHSFLRVISTLHSSLLSHFHSPLQHTLPFCPHDSLLTSETTFLSLFYELVIDYLSSSSYLFASLRWLELVLKKSSLLQMLLYLPPLLPSLSSKMDPRQRPLSLHASWDLLHRSVV